MSELIWNFFFYSFLGFLTELVYARAVHAAKRDRKCFYLLPLCPVYGLGALLILSFARQLAGIPALAAMWSALAATAAEYVMSLVYEKFFRVSFWDYSHLPWNLKGRVCLLYSGFWCGLGLLLIYVVHPLTAPLREATPDWALHVAALALAADSAVTLCLLRRTGSTEVLRWYRRAPVAGRLAESNIKN